MVQAEAGTQPPEVMAAEDLRLVVETALNGCK